MIYQRQFRVVVRFFTCFLTPHKIIPKCVPHVQHTTKRHALAWSTFILPRLSAPLLVQRCFCFRSGWINSILIYLCHSPLDQRPTSHTGTVDFFKVVIWVAHVLAQHDLADVVPKPKKKKSKSLNAKYSEPISCVVDSALQQCSAKKHFKSRMLKIVKNLKWNEISWSSTKGSGVEFGTTEDKSRRQWSWRDLTRTIRKALLQT